MNNKKKEVATITPEETAKAETVESTTPQAEAKTVNLISPEQLQQMLEQQLAEIQHKKMLADHRGQFLRKKNSIAAVLEEMKKAENKGDFEVKTAAITLASGNEYRKDDILSISNTALIIRFIENLILEIDIKVKAIENELLTA